MARLTAPLLSLGASGSIAKALVFASWKGVPYARVHVIPTNPNTVAQQEVRGVFSTLNAMWKRMPQHARDPFLLAARGLALTARNRHIQVNVPVLQDKANLDDLVMSIGTGQAIAPASMTPSDAGAQVLNVLLTAPALPLGYVLASMRAVAVLDGDPSPVLTRTTFADFDTTAPYSIDLSVVDAGTYQVAGYCLFIRTSDGLAFCSAALRATQVIA